MFLVPLVPPITHLNQMEAVLALSCTSLARQCCTQNLVQVAPKTLDGESQNHIYLEFKTPLYYPKGRCFQKYFSAFLSNNVYIVGGPESWWKWLDFEATKGSNSS